MATKKTEVKQTKTEKAAAAAAKAGAFVGKEAASFVPRARIAGSFIGAVSSSFAAGVKEGAASIKNS